ncbi:hypothetical protein [Desemzia sp. FAM 24101]|uniref:hypothetical protein n=1 Tax=unclassified Desemzia TaxID=2685243 RepID=UPI00388AD29C
MVFGVSDVDAEIQKSIDEIIKAGQEKEKALLEADTAKTKAAEAEAEANKKLSESISEELIKLKEVEARLEHGWVKVQTGQAIVDTNE